MGRTADELRLARLRTGHVTPPGPGREAPSRALRVWLFRLGLVLALALVALAVVLLAQAASDLGTDPGLDSPAALPQAGRA